MKKLLLICSIFLFGNQFIKAQSLVAGDIAFIGFHQDTPDGFTFITLTNISAGQVIYFTDHSWSSTDNVWHANTSDAHYAWTAPAGGAPIGTIVSVTESSSDFLTASSGTMILQGGGNFSIVQSGDVLIAYQSTSGAQSTAANTTFLAAIYTDDNYAHNTGCDGLQGWFNSSGSCVSNSSYPSTSANASGIPNGLTNGVNAMHLYPGGVFEADSENDNGRYTGTLNGDAATIRAAINDRTNWEMQDASPFDITATYFNSNTTVNVTPSALGIVENSFSSKLLIYPNPVTNTLYLTSTDTYFKYDVFNIQGKRLTTSNSEIAKTIDFSNFPNGMYLIKVQTEQTIETFKIIKE